MTSAEPLISIALCTFNGALHLKKQMESLINQSYRPLEIIVVDDRSTDDTLSILQEYAKTHNFIHVFENEINLGFVKNFEKALTLCTGQYIAMSDQDDIWMEDKLEIMSRHIGNYDLVYHDSAFIDEYDQLIGNRKMSDHYHVYDGESNLPFLMANCIAGHAMLIKKDLLQFALPFNKAFYHDWWIAFVALTVGKIKVLPDVLVRYRQHADGITDSLDRQSNKVVNPKTELYDLRWIAHCLTFDNKKNPEEITYIYKNLKAHQDGKRGFGLFFFMLKYYNILFYLTAKDKSQLSRLNRIRKFAFKQ